MQETKDYSRRSFLKGAGTAMLAGAAVAGLTGCATTANASAASGIPEKWDRETDVLVVGMGIAGVGAATAAADAGAHVTLIEKAPEEEAGGASRVNGGFMTISEAYWDADYCYRNLKGVYSKDVLAELLDKRTLMEDWVEANPIEGLDWYEFPGYEGYANPSGSWKTYPGLVDAVTSRDIEVLYSTPATELVQNPETGEILGALADGDGTRISIKARKGVVLATGSYGSNKDMVQQFNYPAMLIPSYDSPYNTGDAIPMVAQVGAQLGAFFPESLEYEQFALKVPSEEAGTGIMYHKPSRDVATHIFVNRAGQRFMNEFYDITHTRNRLPIFEWDEESNDYLNSPFWMVFDESFMNSNRIGAYTDKEEIYEEYGTAITMTWNGVFKTAPWSDDNQAELAKGWIFKGDTVEELASKMQAKNGFGDSVTVDPAGLAATIDAYNAACEAGEDAEFGRDPESLHPLSDGPYYAIELCLASMYGYGGPKVDGVCRVVNDNEPIGRLYAAGQVAVTFSPTSCVPTALIGGILAGQDAAAQASWDE